MNHLAGETSPYLRQHADNPVDWYPWGDEAFSRARADDRPLFVSIGYSACHWCHVMAHESFEDADTARELNARFVSVKVDREERPDVDAVYMEAVQALSGHGGWPMSVFVTPDGRPFFAGTYFPPRDANGMPSFRRVLAAVDDAWHQRRDEVERQADALSDAVRRRSRVPDALGVEGDDETPENRSTRLLDLALDELQARADHRWGGFGPAPKFPQPQLVDLCLRHHRLTESASSLAMATTTLGAMAAGGIYDHLGGGFARYSTDATWTVPHFEKMLYDQAGLVRAYLHMWQTDGDPAWLGIVSETVAYVLDTLALPGGGLSSAEDADSEGEEGRFYLWTPAEVTEVLGADLAATAMDWYGVEDGGNFEGRSILRRPVGAPLVRPAAVEEARRLLLQRRHGRVRPGRDDKVLTEWNAMFASALAEAAGATGSAAWAHAASDIATFLVDNLRDVQGRWLRSFHEGHARHLAYAADYAWVVDMCTRLAELTGRRHWLDEAQRSAHDMVLLFSGDDGLLYTTGSDAEELVVRPVEVLDGAIPSANSVAATALLRLAPLVGDDDLRAAGERLVSVLCRVAGAHPLAAANTVAASSLAGGGVTEIVVTGSRPDLVEAARARYEPTMVLAWGEANEAPLWRDRAEGLAYVCRHSVCRLPAADTEELRARLDDELRTDRALAGTDGRPS